MKMKDKIKRWYHNRRSALRSWLVRDVTGIQYSNDDGMLLFFTKKYMFYIYVDQITKSDFKVRDGAWVDEYTRDKDLLNGTEPTGEPDGIKGLYPVPEGEKIIRIFKDGGQICALLGENIQVGNAGFGDTIHEALRNLADDLED